MNKTQLNLMRNDPQYQMEIMVQAMGIIEGHTDLVKLGGLFYLETPWSLQTVLIQHESSIAFTRSYTQGQTYISREDTMECLMVSDKLADLWEKACKDHHKLFKLEWAEDRITNVIHEIDNLLENYHG